MWCKCLVNTSSMSNVWYRGWKSTIHVQLAGMSYLQTMLTTNKGKCSKGSKKKKEGSRYY